MQILSRRHAVGPSPGRRQAGYLPSGREGPWRDRTFLVLAGFIVLCFLFGGGSRADIQGLMYLRPLSVIVLCYGLHGLTFEQVKANIVVFALAFAAILLTLLHLVPLPPLLWQALPGRDVIVAVDRAAGLGSVWRPLSMVPSTTWNALWSMMAPLAVLVLGVQLDRKRHANLLVIILAVGVFSALLGLLQILGDLRSPLYFYEVTHRGVPVGLFSNRNHHAAFLAALLPMLMVQVAISAARASGERSPYFLYIRGVALAAAAFLLPMILMTGSRSGMVVMCFCIVATPLVLWGISGEQRSRFARWGLWIIPLLAVGLVLLTISFGRALSIDRMARDPEGDWRFRILPEVLSMIKYYMPWGSGIGSFQNVYAMREPDDLLHGAYMNHAHNDWLEVLLTGGAPAAVILALVFAGIVARSVRLIRVFGNDVEGMLLGRLGVVVILTFAFASITDYPLRTPALLCLGTVAVLWTGLKAQPLRQAVAS